MKHYSQLSKDKKQSFWQDHISSWKSSQMTQKGYCHTHQLNKNTFTYWLNRFRRQEKPMNLIPLPNITLDRAHSGESLEVIINQSLTLRIPANIDMSHLKKVLQTLGAPL